MFDVILNLLSPTERSEGCGVISSTNFSQESWLITQLSYIFVKNDTNKCSVHCLG